MDNNDWRGTWPIPTVEEYTAAFDKARASQKLVTYITIRLKMRMSHKKRDILLLAHKRVTIMKALVFALFQADLEAIDSGQTHQRLVDDILAAMRTHATKHGVLSADEETSISSELQRLVQGDDILAAADRIVHALVECAQNTTGQQSALGLLYVLLEHWQTQHANKALQTTLQKLEEKKNRGADDLMHLKYSVLLRRFLETASSTHTDVLLVISIAEARYRKQGDGARMLYSILSRCYSRLCTSHLFPLGGTLRDGIYSECAETLVAWCEKIIGYYVDEIGAQLQRAPDQCKAEKRALRKRFRYQRVTKILELYQLWSAAERKYRAAAANKMPSGPHAGKSLGKHQRQELRKSQMLRKRTVIGRGIVGKKGTRRLLRQLLSPETAERILTAVDRLLYPTRCTEEELADAKRTPHPWWRRKVRRTIEANVLLQQRNTPKFRSIPLSQLTQNQLWILRDQLLEMLQLAAQFKQLKADAELFIRGAPPSFPFVKTPVLSDAELEQLPDDLRKLLPQSFEKLYGAYSHELNWFRDLRSTRGGPLASYDTEHLYDIETLAAQRLEQAAAQLQEGKLQPLFFKRTTPANLSTLTFGLLWYQRNRKGQDEQRYILMLEPANAHAPEHKEILKTRRAEELPVYKHVNYPERPFALSSDDALVFFPLEFGDTYQGRLLQETLQAQEVATKNCVKGCQFASTGMHLPDCQPMAALTTATIVAEQSDQGLPEWFVHLPIPIVVPPTISNPSVIVGYHEHPVGYSFAAIDLDGNIRACGDVLPPKHVGPNHRNGQKSDNYAFEMAVRIARIAKSINENSFVGIEDTHWRKDTVSLSASENRATFEKPSQRIFEIATYKARMEGLLQPIATRGVAPTRDCGRCGHRSNESHGVRRHVVTHCYDCAIRGQTSALKAFQSEDGKSALRCTICQKIWQRREYEFKCTACGWRMLARYNTAIAVARRTLRQIVDDQLKQKKDKEEEEDWDTP